MKLRFHDDLERQVGYEALLVAQRRRAHEASAAVLEARLPGGASGLADAELREIVLDRSPRSESLEPGSAELAFHHVGAGGGVRAAAFCVLAIRDAFTHSRFDEGVERALQAADLAEACGEHSLAAFADIHRAAVLERLSRYPEALVALEAAEARLSGAAERTELLIRARIWNESAVLLLRAGRVEECLAVHGRAGELARKLGDSPLEAEILNGMGAAHYAKGNYEAALRAFETAIHRYAAAGRPSQASGPVINSAIVRQIQGEYARALALLESAVEAARTDGDRYRLGTALLNVGIVKQSTGDIVGALRVFEECLALDLVLGNRRGEASCRNNLGFARFVLGDLDEALEDHRRAFALRLDLSDREGILASRNNLAQVLHGLGRIDEARSEADEAIRESRELALKGYLAEAVLMRSLCELAEGRSADAARSAEESLALVRETGEAEGRLRAQIALALARQDDARAEAAAAEAHRIGHREQEARAYLAVAEIHAARGDVPSARAAAAACESLARAMQAKDLLRRSEAFRG